MLEAIRNETLAKDLSNEGQGAESDPTRPACWDHGLLRYERDETQCCRAEQTHARQHRQGVHGAS